MDIFGTAPRVMPARRKFVGWGVVTAAAVALAMTLVGAGTASAEAPSTPRPAASCTAQLELDPNPVLFGRTTQVIGTVDGLDPGASFNVFVEGQRLISGFVDVAGRATFGLIVETVTAVAFDVQLATETRCAAGQLIVAGPLQLRCTVDLDGTIICPLVD